MSEETKIETTQAKPAKKLRDGEPKMINRDISEFVAAATAQMTGVSGASELDVADVIDIGNTWDFTEREQWVKILTGMYIKDMYTDRPYKDRRNDVFYEDSAKFGAVSRVISMEMPDVIANRSWENITSGVTQIGCNTVYLPIVDQQLYGATDSWGVSIAYTGTQLNAAFESAAGINEFDNYVKLMAQNSIELHRKTMNSVNRNNYIMEKLAFQEMNPGVGCHVINLVEEYCKDHGVASMSVSDFFSNPDVIRYSVKTFKKYKELLMDMTKLFTTKADSKGKFIPSDRFVFQVLSDFEGRLDSEVYSTTYHDEFIKLPLYRPVTAWQTLSDSENLNSADFYNLSSLSMYNSTTSHGYDESGIVGLMVDKWAIMHTMVQNRVGYQRDDIKDISMYDYQFTDRYMNNLTLNGCVFVVWDVSAGRTVSPKEKAAKSAKLKK